jgi:acetyltransferase-like isoleucine patch superfamily enzyme
MQSRHPPQEVFEEMPVFKLILAALVSLIPVNGLRVLGYRLLFGYYIAESQIGFGSVILVESASIENARLGLFNLVVGPMKVVMKEGTTIGNRNTFSCGYWVLREQYKQSHYTRTLELGKNVLITSGHYFDVAGTFKLGNGSWIAGIGSQFWTHGAGVRERDIVIGKNCYLASAVRFSPGSCIGDNVLVAMGSVVTGVIAVDKALVGGIPARVLKENYDWKSNDERETEKNLSNG